MFDELVLPERAELQQDTDGQAVLSLKLRLPWYRSLPLSCIDAIELAIDGTPVDSSEVSIGVGDGYHSLTETRSLDDTWWFVLDTAEARIRGTNGVEAGEHSVAVSLTLHIPYPSSPGEMPEFIETAEFTRSVQFEGRAL